MTIKQPDFQAETLVFPALEQTGLVDHLISTRVGGVSGGIYSTMNLSYTRGDSKEAVDENYRRIAVCLGREPEDFVCSDQTHTVNVRRVTAKDRGKGVTVAKDYADVDGLITNEAGLVLATFYADCVPLFLVDPIKKAIGLSHSGWRGTVSRMGRVTLEAMRREFGTRPQDVLAAIGPSICGDCYEVGEEVAAAFREAYPEEENRRRILHRKENGRYLLDLWEANRLLLNEAGVPASRISVTDICTCCNPRFLFSHRASQGKRGNFGAFLSLR